RRRERPGFAARGRRPRGLRAAPPARASTRAYPPAGRPPRRPGPPRGGAPGPSAPPALPPRRPATSATRPASRRFRRASSWSRTPPPRTASTTTRTAAPTWTASRTSSGARVLGGERLVAGSGFPAIILRLAGIYGPGRTRLVDRVRDGLATCSDGPPRWTNRIHRDDCAGPARHLLPAADPGTLWLRVDDEPA